MVTAILLMKIQRTRVNEVAEKLVGMQGITEVYSVGGRYDLIAIIRVKENEALADLVTKKLAVVEGILDTETLIAFRAYSKHDLEHMFSIGFETE
ncbi:MAG: Lrp/AsnC family transcriptional regulator [Candidatus Marinimicrobia bacterium]|nr:Lrp/AsnC family transcriptional regulator [Candidatus Neomarinimicrobiota bacterium]